MLDLENSTHIYRHDQNLEITEWDWASDFRGLASASGVESFRVQGLGRL